MNITQKASNTIWFIILLFFTLCITANVQASPFSLRDARNGYKTKLVRIQHDT